MTANNPQATPRTNPTSSSGQNNFQETIHGDSDHRSPHGKKTQGMVCEDHPKGQATFISRDTGEEHILNIFTRTASSNVPPNSLAEDELS